MKAALSQSRCVACSLRVVYSRSHRAMLKRRDTGVAGVAAAGCMKLRRSRQLKG